MKYGFLSLMLASVLSAGVPKVISYQGQLSNSSGSPVDGTVTITFSLYKDVSGGTAIWSEIQTISVSNGLLNVQLGSVNPLIETLFDSDPVYLGIKVGADPEMIPKQKMTAGAFSQTAVQVTSPVPGDKIAIGAVRTQHAGRDSTIKSYYVSTPNNSTWIDVVTISEDKDYIITDIYWAADFSRLSESQSLGCNLEFFDGLSNYRIFSGGMQPQNAEGPVGTNFISFKAGLLVPAGTTLRAHGGNASANPPTGIALTIAGFEVPIN